MATSNVSHLNNADAAQQRERQDEYLLFSNEIVFVGHYAGDFH